MEVFYMEVASDGDYRLLSQGDLIKMDDEYYDVDLLEWRRVPNTLAGHKYIPGQMVQVRRVLKK